MEHKQHRQRAIELTGKPYDEVHVWLDELFKWVGPMHRHVRHNRKGVEKVIEMFGEEAGLVAEQHIKDDGEYLAPKEVAEDE